MSSIAHPELLAEIAAFCERSSMSAATFGKQAMGDPRFVYDIRSGRQCLPRTVEKARAFMVSYTESAA
jgi:hypothetical protein